MCGGSAALQNAAPPHGQFITAEIGNDSIVVLRDGERLRGFHNVCLHRAGPVASGCGRRRTLQCRYHGWTYRLDGTLLRAPEMEGGAGFTPDDMHLVPVQVATWGPLVFANLDGKAPPLLEGLEDIPSRVAAFHCESMRYVTRKSWDIACNWKVYVDNYLEGYHLPVVHPGLHKELDYDRYRVEPRRWFSIQHAPLRRCAPCMAGTRRSGSTIPPPPTFRRRCTCGSFRTSCSTSTSARCRRTS